MNEPIPRREGWHMKAREGANIARTDALSVLEIQDCDAKGSQLRITSRVEQHIKAHLF